MEHGSGFEKLPVRDETHIITRKLPPKLVYPSPQKFIDHQLKHFNMPARRMNRFFAGFILGLNCLCWPCILARPLDGASDPALDPILQSYISRAEQPTLGMDIIPSDYKVEPTWHTTLLDPINLYDATLDTLLKIAVVDPKGRIGPITFRYNNVAIQVAGTAGLVPIPAVFAAFGIYEGMYMQLENLKFVEADFSMTARGIPCGTVALRQARGNEPTFSEAMAALGVADLNVTAVLPIPQPDTTTPTTASPITPFKLKRQDQTQQPQAAGGPNDYKLNEETTVSWAGKAIPNWEFYLSLSTLAVKIAPRTIEDKKKQTQGENIYRDTPAYKLAVQDITPAGGAAFMTLINVVQMCNSAFQAGKIKATKEEVGVQTIWRTDQGQERARWYLSLQDSIGWVVGTPEPSPPPFRGNASFTAITPL